MKPYRDNNILVRSYHMGVELKIVIELVIVARKLSESGTEPVHEISCGWCSIDIGKNEFKNNKINGVVICGGTPLSPEPINKEDISGGRSAIQRLATIIGGKPEPKMFLRIAKATQRDEMNFG